MIDGPTYDLLQGIKKAIEEGNRKQDEILEVLSKIHMELETR